jgi:hypothetical protein
MGESSREMLGGGDPACVDHCPSVENYDRSVFVEEEEEVDERNHLGESNSSNGSSSLIVSSKEPYHSLLQRGQALQSLIHLETVDGDINEVEREVALFSPLVQREVKLHGRGSSRDFPVVLPKQVRFPAVNPILSIFAPLASSFFASSSSSSAWHYLSAIHMETR